MRVVFLLSGFLHYTSELANALVAEGHDVTIIAPDSIGDFVGSGTGDPKQDYRDILDERINLEWFHRPSDTNLATLGANIACIRRINSLLKQYRPDILHLMDCADYRIYIPATRCMRRCPSVLTVHDASHHPGDLKNRMEFLRRPLRRRADLVITLGDDIAKRLLEEGDVTHDTLRTIPRGPYDMYKQWLTGKPVDEKSVLLFGRVSRYKGLDYLIEAAPKVVEKIPDAKFVIAGSGPDWPRCKAMIKNPDYFVLKEEKVKEPEVTALFESASVVVLPYIEASQSGVLFIAYALGKPAIVTCVGSLPEVVDDGETGIIIPPADSDALADAIIRVLTDDALRLRLGENAREKASTGDLSWATIARKTTGVYQEAIDRRKSPQVMK